MGFGKKKKDKAEQAVEQAVENKAYGGVLPEKVYDYMLVVFCLAMCIMHMVYAKKSFLQQEVYLTLHMFFSFIILFISTAKKSGSKLHNVILFLSVALTFAFTIYVCCNLEALRMRQWVSTNLDIVVGCTMIFLALYACWLGFGKFIPILVIIVCIYPFFGKMMPGPFHTSALPFSRTISNLSIGLTTGLYDSTLTISANYTFLFCVFGGVMSATGVQKFFGEFGKWTVGRFRSGSAQITVVNTAMVGMVCGNAIANVTMTGPYCIDNMKKNGYNPTTATAISCVGSNGGQILPPVMGIVAFSMAGYAGIPYWTICKMAIISAILYYLSLSLYAHLHALKTPELRSRIVEKPVVDWDVMKWKGPAFVVPFIIIITLLIQGKSVMVCGFWAIISVIIMSYLAPKRHRPKLLELVDGFVEGAKQGAQMGACCAVIGMLVCTFTTSGMGVKLTSGIESWSHGSLFLALLILYIASIVAGMAGVSVAAYFTAAAFAVPALQKLGIAYATAHFFCVYPASYATITPPVALTTLVGTQISGTPYGKTAVECCKICGVSFLAPFLFVYAPVMLLEGSLTDPTSYIQLLSIIVLTVAAQFTWVNYFCTDLTLLERAMFFLSFLTLILYIFMSNNILCVIGLALFAAAAAAHIIKWKKNKKNLVSTAAV